VVAAAGSGKTYLAAFDALNFNPKRLLYVVHEGSILKKSLETFQFVFGSEVSYGIFSGESKEMDAYFVFATNLTMCRSLELFRKNEFDYIIIDECHHATAESYRKIIEYFEPEFLLGLTATPERMDNEDVFALFDKNVPYELRLRDAIINDLVVPFRYYGIRDTLVDYNLNKAEERRMIAQFCTVDHCELISREIEAHRPAGKLKALAFCRNLTHARMMCEAMGEHYHTAYLTGHNDIGERIRAYNDLQNDAAELEILFTVDILNEGVDIPGVNMVLFLRPTESSTIFIQQLGRGLRKFDNKDFVTVLDFIGNSYKRSVQIAFALSSLAENFVLEKRLMRSLVQDDFQALGLADYGVEIHIDALSKEEILDGLEHENFNSLAYMKQDYFNFKKYIRAEAAPTHTDYMNNDCAPDLGRFMSIKISGQKTGCYYNFLKGIGEENLPLFSEAQIALLKYASGLLPLVRQHEFLILQALIGRAMLRDALQAMLENEIAGFAPAQMEHALLHLRKSGVVTQEEPYALTIPIDDQFEEHLRDLLRYGLARYEADYENEAEFLLWHNYSMSQVQLKLLKDPNYTQLGTYVYDDTVVIFASLKKDASVEERLNYKDKFLTANLFQWECETNIRAEKLKGLMESKTVHVFVRKVRDEHGIVLPFTYVGKGRLINPRRQEIVEAKTGKLSVTYLFDIPMEHALPDYLQYDFGLTGRE
jgi:hypothetical protein